MSIRVAIVQHNGAVEVVVSMGKNRPFLISHIFWLIGGAIGMLTVLATLTSCSLTPDRMNYDDPQFKPMWQAVGVVDRQSLGFTPIEHDAQIRLEGRSDSYDAMLHVYGTTSRTIAFRKRDSGYEWIGEQEIHTGPRKYTTPDGTFNETIVITYDRERISGYATGQVIVSYSGPDRNLSLARALTLADVSQMTKEWDEARRRQSP